MPTYDVLYRQTTTHRVRVTVERRELVEQEVRRRLPTADGFELVAHEQGVVAATVVEETERRRKANGETYEVLAVNGSNSTPGQLHEIRREADGRVRCTCRGFSHHKHCWHMDAYLGSESVTRRGVLQRVASFDVQPHAPTPTYTTEHPAHAAARALATQTGRSVRAIVLMD